MNATRVWLPTAAVRGGGRRSVNMLVGGLLALGSNGVPYDRLSGLKLTETVWALYEESRQRRSAHVSDWRTYRNFYHGIQPDYPTNPKNHFNRIRGQIDFGTATLVEGGFDLNVVPSSKEDIPLAEELEVAGRWSIEATQARSVVRSLVRDGFVEGTSVGKVIWNPDLEQGYGNSRLVPVPLENFYPDLGGYDEETFSYVIEEVFLTVDYAKRRWDRELPAEGFNPESPATVLPSQWEAVSPVMAAYAPQRPEFEPAQFTLRTAKVLVAYLRDWILADAGIPIPEKMRGKSKYPDWFVAVVGASGEPLEVSDNPYGQHLPYVFFRPNPESGKFYGISEVRDLIPPQKDYNLRRHQVARHAQMSAVPKMGIDPDKLLGQDAKAIDDRPGGVFFGEQGAVFYVDPPGVDPSFFDSAEMSLRDMQHSTGFFDISMGAYQSQLTAGVAIEQLQAAAQVRVNAISDAEYHPFLRDISRRYVYNLKNWTQARIIRLAGENRRATLREVDIARFVTNMDEVLRFDVDVKIGQKRAEQAARESLAIQAANVGMIDRRAFLEAVGWENWEFQADRMEREELERAGLVAQAERAEEPEEVQENPLLPENLAGIERWEDAPVSIRGYLEEIAADSGPRVAQRAFEGLKNDVSATAV